jgi:hypothetical protein
MNIAKPIEAKAIISGTLVFKNDAGEVVKTVEFSTPLTVPLAPQPETPES